MTTWEYLSVDSITVALTDFGAEGWELCAVWNEKWYFKRPKQEQEPEQQFLKNVRDRAEFWRTNSEDPHGIGTAVYVALTEICHALADARKQQERPGAGLNSANT